MRKGFTLIEFSISLFIVLVGVFGTFTVIQRVSHYSSLNSSKIQAAYLAEEGIEIIRNIRDSNYVITSEWSNGIANSPGSYQLDVSSRVFPDPNCSGKDYLVLDSRNAPFYYTCTSSPGPEKFQRSIFVESGIDLLIVVSKVTWKEKGVSQELFIQANFYDWYRPK
jgi:prepilin-type N-terminal cleavage/methylation domain-containing protein